MAMPKRMEVSLGAPVDIDVFTSAPSGTLPVGTRLPRALIDAARSEHAQPARLRGFATIPPVTPKVLTLKNDVVSTAEADASGADRASLPAPFDAPKFDQTLAFGTTPNPYGAGGAGAPREALGTTPSPITPRAKRPLPAASSEANTDVPRVPSSTLMSERMAPESALLDTTPSTGTRPVALQRATEETFRPSAHTTPPGLPEVRKLPNYVWAVAVLPVAALVALATFKFEGTSAAQGAVVLEGGTTPVVTRVAGPVVQVLVKPGDSLTAGQAVAEIDPSTLDQRREELKAREAALLAERERVTTLGAKWHSAATDALQRKRAVLWQRLALRNGDGTEGSASKERSSSDRDALLLIRQELADVEFELNRRESDRDDQQRTWEHRMNEVRTELAQVNDSSTSVRAPVSGRVEALLATPGQVLTAGSPIARLIPDGAEKQIVVLVPTRLSETLNVGTELPLTLPLDQATTLPARVTHIADGNVTREEAASLLSAPQLEPLVRVEVELVDPNSAPNLASALRPGQRVSALVPDEKRSLWRHLVSKFE
jgi:multidrug resistance efflux pump